MTEIELSSIEKQSWQLVVPGLRVFISCFFLLNALLLFGSEGDNNLRESEISIFPESTFLLSENQSYQNSNFNVFFITTPYDCPCYNYLFNSKFVAELQLEKIDARQIQSVSYIISGDFSIDKLRDYGGSLSNSVPIFIDHKNNIKNELYSLFNTFHTPYLIVAKNDSIIDDFKIEFSKDSLFNYLKSSKIRNGK
ncbi:MAG: hypothetical protein K9N46_16535 [Candidatus Marinimicrobia bacterium]|nr:hypothetical protein [Candidatus Neomarinimicrobiota bacterium]MCF7829456.1 hypothetical protein [Candidatus Neomarinimicrobiota bacterium]MCF7882335.1 hypothetical protein [Candidatus Neomarinimicrobiota bacterium]